MELKVRLFNKAGGILIGTALGGREQYPGIKQTGKNSVEVIIEPVSGADHGADPVQSELIIDLLNEKIPAIKAALLIHREILSGR